MGNEWLLLDINPKKSEKIPTATKIKINVFNKFLSDLLKNYVSYYSMEWKTRQYILTSNKTSVLILSRLPSLPYWDSRCSDWLSWAQGEILTQQLEEIIKIIFLVRPGAQRASHPSLTGCCHWSRHLEAFNYFVGLASFLHNCGILCEPTKKKIIKKSSFSFFFVHLMHKSPNNYNGINI